MNIKNKLLSVLYVYFILLFVSCSNIINTKTSDVTLNIGQVASEQLSKVAFSETSDIKIECEFNGINLPKQSVITTKQNLNNTTLTISNIPFGRDFTIVISVYFNSVIVYQGESNTINLSEENVTQNVDITINEKNAIINYNCMGGALPVVNPDNNEKLPSVDVYSLSKPFTINSFGINCRTPEKSGYSFEKWYLDEQYSKPFDTSYTLGADNFIGNVTLYANWTNVPPSDVIDPIVKPGNTCLTLYWQNPPELDLKSVKIYKRDGSDVEIATMDCTPDKISSYKVNNLTNDTDYTFVIKAIDKEGLESNEVVFPATAPRDPVPASYLHKTATTLSDGLIQFGDYPQTQVSGVAIDESKTYICNSMPCYKGADDNYYVKNNGIFYKIEPVKWRVINDNFNGGKFLLADKALIGSCFDANNSNKYENSTAYKLLTIHFYNDAFSQDSKDNINPLLINNNAENVFLLGEKEIIDSNGFQGAWDWQDSRKRYSTDYAIGTGAYKNEYSISWWWTRTEREYGQVLSVAVNGDVHQNESPSNGTGSIVPALIIK